MKNLIRKLAAVILSLTLTLIPSLPSFAATGVTFSGVNEIPNIRQGRPYDITGTLKASSGKKITYFQGEIWNLSDGIQEAEIHYNPNSATVDIHNSKVNNLKFGDLYEGEYMLYLYAKDSSGATNQIRRHFWVLPATTQMDFDIDAPSSIPAKSSYNLTGMITSTSKITKVIARIYKNGKLITESPVVKPNTPSFNVGTSNVNYGLKFSKCTTTGYYKLKISAWDSDGQHDEFYDFYVY